MLDADDFLVLREEALLFLVEGFEDDMLDLKSIGAWSPSGEARIYIVDCDSFVGGGSGRRTH